MLLLLPTLPPFTVLPLLSPPKTLYLQKPLPFRSRQHHRTLPSTPTRACASLSSTTEENVVSIISVLRSHGIPEDACTAIVSTWSGSFLRMRALGNLDPKLQLLRSVGLSGAEVGEILLVNRYLLKGRLHPNLCSFVTFLVSILPSKKDLVRLLKSVLCCPVDRLKANLQALRDLGVPESVIHKILLHYPRSLVSSTEKVAAVLEATKELRLSPTDKIIPSVVGRAPYIKKASFSRTVDFLKELGWSEEQALSLCRKHPQLLSYRDGLIRKKFVYFNEVLGWGPEVILLSPSILWLSLEKRITPRCAVLNVLMMKGLLEEKKTSRPWSFKMSEKRFFEKYVDKYKEEVPEVLEAYEGKVEFTGWGWLKD